MKSGKLQKGYTLIEVIVVIGIFATLVGLATISLGSVERTSSLNSEVNKMIPDFKQQQIKAMSGDTEGVGVADNYGIHFSQNSYTLFKGTYSAGNSSNLVIDLAPNLEISSTLPSSEVIFLEGSGQVSGFTAGSNTITVTDTAGGGTQTVTVNKYGVITGVN